MMLRSHIINMQLYKYTCRIHIDAIIKTSEDFFKKIYLSLYLQGLCVRGSWRPNGRATYWPPLLWPSALSFSCCPGLLNRKPGGPLCWVRAFSTASCHQRVSKLTDFLSSLSYIIVPSPTQYLWNGMFYRHQAELTVMQFTLFRCINLWQYHGILACPILSAKPAYAISSHNCHRNVSLPLSLEWHVCPGRRSIYNNDLNFGSPENCPPIFI